MAKKTSKKKASASGMPNAAPKDGTICAKIWALCQKHKGNRQAVLKEAAQRKYNEATVTTQYGRWRVFTGYVKPKSVKVVKAKGAKPAKVAKRKAPKAKTAPAPAAAAPDVPATV